MWIYKNSKDLLDTSSFKSHYVCNSLKTFDFLKTVIFPFVRVRK